MNDEIYRTLCRGCKAILQRYPSGWHHLKFIGTSTKLSGTLDLAMDRVCTPEPVETDPPRSFPTGKRRVTLSPLHLKGSTPKKKKVDKGG